MRKRMLAAVALVVIAGSVLAACGSDAKAPSTGGTSPTPTTVAPSDGSGGRYGY